jgi:acetyl-CoA/propionyl-CoA carboxylase biotin carboxyl carrier protein
VTGFDLVELQLRAAAGEVLDLDVQLQGHAIEARVNAEDAQFFPSAGEVLVAAYPRGVRVDAAVETGSVVGTDYDSMIAKVIAHGRDRRTALARLDRALADTAILGLETNVGFLRTLLGRDDVRAGELDTGLIGRLDPVQPPLTDEQVAHYGAVLALESAATRASDDPFDRRDGWRLGGERAPSYWKLSVNGGDPIAVVLKENVKGTVPFRFVRRGRTAWLAYEGWAWQVAEATVEDERHAHADGDLRAPMPGSVLLVQRAVGDTVEAGQTVVVLESMKMELSLVAPVDGTVTELFVSVGDKVGRDVVVARIEA